MPRPCSAPSKNRSRAAACASPHHTPPLLPAATRLPLNPPRTYHVPAARPGRQGFPLWRLTGPSWPRPHPCGTGRQEAARRQGRLRASCPLPSGREGPSVESRPRSAPIPPRRGRDYRSSLASSTPPDTSILHHAFSSCCSSSHRRRLGRRRQFRLHTTLYHPCSLRNAGQPILVLEPLQVVRAPAPYLHQHCRGHLHPLPIQSAPAVGPLRPPPPPPMRTMWGRWRWTKPHGLRWRMKSYRTDAPSKPRPLWWGQWRPLCLSALSASPAFACLPGPSGPWRLSSPRRGGAAPLAVPQLRPRRATPVPFRP